MTLSIEGNAKLSKLLGERFKRFIYWNKDKVINNKEEGNSMIQLIKESNDSLFLLMIIQKATMMFLLILPKNIFCQELKQKITTSKLMEETFMINQLMTELSNRTKSKKY